MVGRPERVLDVELAAQLRARRIQSKITTSAMARRLGVATTTLSRSLKEDSFSKDLGDRVRALLAKSNNFESPKAAPKEVGSGSKLSEKDVQILQKIIGLLPLAEAIIKKLVERTGVKE